MQQPSSIGGPNVPSDARLNIDQPFDISSELHKALDDHLQAEQWLHEQGIRGIVTAIGSADTREFLRGVKKLQHLFVTRFADGYRAGIHTVRWYGLAGAASGTAIASILWAAAWVFLR